MNEDQKHQAAEMLADLCHLEALYGGTCPKDDYGGCPFRDIRCADVEPQDWLECMG